VHEHLERGERTALRRVDDRDSRVVPASWVLGGAEPVKGVGKARLLADTPGPDQAKIPCSMRPKRGATILIPSAMVDSMNVGGVLGLSRGSAAVP
jgi:hypothetical protein